jgi:hypothetical protein
MMLSRNVPFLRERRQIGVALPPSKTDGTPLLFHQRSYFAVRLEIGLRKSDLVVRDRRFPELAAPIEKIPRAISRPVARARCCAIIPSWRNRQHRMRKAKSGDGKRPHGISSDPAIAAVFGAYEKDVRAKLLQLRRLIFDTAQETEGVGGLEETLKWGQPSYLTPHSKSGSTIRIDRVKAEPDQVALYFHCQTNLVATFRELYPQELRYDGNRAIVLDVKGAVPEPALRHCISLALTYHLKARGTVKG